MPRQARLDAPGTLHHVIVRGIEKRRIVDDRTDRDNFVSRLGQIASETETVIYAWALMTNHAHIFLRSGPYGLSKKAMGTSRKQWGHKFINKWGSGGVSYIFMDVPRAPDLAFWVMEVR